MAGMNDTPPQLPVPAGPRTDHDVSRGRQTRGRGNGPADSSYAAQLLGGGEKRGLKGGTETLERAKASYLKSEYSGPNDRRPQPGRVTRTQI